MKRFIIANMKINKSICVSFLILTLSHLPVLAQWKHLVQFDGKRINSLYFMDEEGKPDWGVLGVFDTITSEASLYYTRDAGRTWNLSVFPAHLKSFNFAFKDTSTGWVGTNLKFAINNRKDGDSILLLITHNGGVNWEGIPCSGSGYFPCGPAAQAGPTFVAYSNKSKLLFITGSGESGVASSDEGNSFFLPINNYSGEGQMISFIDNEVGCWSDGGSTAHTTDAGVSWYPQAYSGFPDDPHNYQNLRSRYRALPISGTNTFMMIGTSVIHARIFEYGLIFRSDDGGINWQYVGELPQTVHPVTYLQGDLNRLVAETDNGVWISEDEGVSWRSVCGPSRNSPDSVGYRHRYYRGGVDSAIGTSLYVKGNRIYISDNSGGLWFLDAKDIPAKIKYPFSSLSINQMGCNSADSLIEIKAHDLCTEAQAKLINASIHGSSHFTITSKSPPYSFTGIDSIGINYSEPLPIYDTAFLDLHYQIGSQSFDTTITLFGFGKQPTDYVTFAPVLSESIASVDSTVELSILPDKAVIGKNLKSVSFDLNYNSDLLDRISFHSDVPNSTLTFGSETRTGKVATLPITITGSDLSFDPSHALAAFKYHVMVTDTSSTRISISNLKLNGGDQNYNNCVLSSATTDTSFTAILHCGEFSAQTFLKTGSVFSINSIHPNPVIDEIVIEVQSDLTQNAIMEIFDALGTKIYSEDVNLTQRLNSVRFDTKALSDGVYTIRLRSTKGLVSESFVKVK
jgi:hypothetical protein